ncbi:MAG: SH3 domain-containing protein [Ectothiorhodospiraceae bacterium]|nr:SH3 domain-containing protein [Ectothiorhodospiraceae bacterium]
MPVILLLLLLLFTSQACADDAYPEVKVAAPYIELHTGPGSGYPIFHVVDRGEYIEVIRRKTDWFKVRTEKGETGWVARMQMEKTLTPSGETAEFADASLGDFSKRRWEAGVVGGTFNGAPVMTLYGAFVMSANLSVELSASRVTGDFSSSELANFNIVSQPFPTLRFSPFFTLGIGQIKTTPNLTLIRAEDSQDLIAHMGVGVKVYLTRRFILRAEYKNYVGFSSDDDNEEFEEWKAGFAFFF